MTLRLALLASGRGSNVRAIVRALDEGTLDARVVGVLSDRSDAAVLDFAKERGYATHIEPLRKDMDRNAWNGRVRDALRAWQPDIVVLAGFMRVLGADVINAFSLRIVNVHPSLLPAFPGKSGPADAIAGGARVTGCTVHLVDEGVDTGPILAQAAIAIAPNDDADSLHHRIQKLEHALLPQVLAAFARGHLRIEDGRVMRRDDAHVDLEASVLSVL